MQDSSEGEEGSSSSSGSASSPSAASRSRKHGDGDDCVLRAAEGIYRLRFVFVILWPALTAILVPFAGMLVLRAAPMTKHAPRGTESTAAMAMFERHFQDLSTVRREMVEFRCKVQCESAANDMSRFYIQDIVDLVKRFGNDNPGTVVQVNSYYTFAGHHQLGGNPMMSADRQAILLQWLWRVPAQMKVKAESFIVQLNEELENINMIQGAGGLAVSSTGLLSLDHAVKEVLIEEIPVHEISTLWMPTIILALALRSPRMLLLALLPMPMEIVIAFGLMYFVSLRTTVLLYALMMMLMLCTSLSFDYSLFTLTRYAEERANGKQSYDAIITVISQSGRIVVVSGCVLLVAWSAMLGLPNPFKSFCIAASTMIVVCVFVQLTFVPSLLAIMPCLGPPAARRVSPRESSLPLENGNGSAKHALNDSDEEDGAMARAAPHMQGLGFCLGKWLTAFPFNILVPLVIYALFMPLTIRMKKNFDLHNFRFQMGHSYELTVPRQRREWSTALRIQRDFPREAGTLMPMMILAHNDFPQIPNTTQNVTPLDVRGQEFFEANCRMVDSLIAATRHKPYALGPKHFVGVTFRGEDESGGVKCLDYELLKMVRSNYWARHWFLTHTSANLRALWDQLVSEENNAMITFVFPDMDPFSPQAFELIKVMREALWNETKAAQTLEAAIPGLTFTTFSPGSVLMDIIDVTSLRLPITFLACVGVCFTLIAVWFKAALMPFKLLLTVVVPITWTYGAALKVYEDGALTWCGIPGLLPTGDAGIDWTVPMFTLTFNVGLALDYDVFLFERIREFREEGFGDRESIQLGLSATGGTISSAGLIMALTFTAQLLASIPVLNQLGFVIAISIMVDTFVVRTVLVPAMLSLSPGMNYWPTKMPPPRYVWLSGCGQGSPESPAHKDWDAELSE